MQYKLLQEELIIIIIYYIVLNWFAVQIAAGRAGAAGGRAAGGEGEGGPGGGGGAGQRPAQGGLGETRRGGDPAQDHVRPGARPPGPGGQDQGNHHT